MSGRNRGRANANQDADEERRLWKEIRDKAKEVDAMVARSNEIGQEIITVEAEQAALQESGKATSTELDTRLEALYRENVKLCEEVSHIVEGNPNGMNLLDSLDVLTGLRRASEETAAQQQLSQPPQRAASSKLTRPPKKGSRVNTAAAASTEDAEDVAAAPSPRISLTNRLSKDAKSRQGSVATTREASVKPEDGAESVASSTDGVAAIPPHPNSASKASAASSAAAARITNRLVLTKGEIVFCRHDPKNFDPKKAGSAGDAPEGEGILCRVTAVIGEGKQRRYEVQDADTSDDPPPPQRASVSQLIQIPETNRGLGELPKGKQVLAQYPETTTFYKAEVCETWNGKSGKDGEIAMVRLNFQEDVVASEVERRFVLTER